MYECEICGEIVGGRGEEVIYWIVWLINFGLIGGIIWVQIK